MYDLTEINYKTVSDPKGFCEECEADYDKKIATAAKKISENRKNSPIILLSGPSGSGKTTTARKISEKLEKEKGIKTHYISMDDYYKDVTPETTPRTEDGEYDLESPLCLDMDLLNEHFSMLSRGEKVYVPKFVFSRRMRATSPLKSIRLGKDEMCVFEGIHALNEAITNVHPEAFKLYISARSNVEFNDAIVFKKEWFRLIRRLIRDFNFRGTSAEETLKRWGSVIRGEHLYISPFKGSADYQFDTSMECELPVFNVTASKLFSNIPDGIEKYDELKNVYPAIQLFGVIDEDCVSKTSLLREFIGGGEE